MPKVTKDQMKIAALKAALEGLMKYFVGERSSKNLIGESGIACDQARAALASASHDKLTQDNAALDKAHNALKVILFTPRTRIWLRDNEPMAYVQAAEAVPIASLPANAPEAMIELVRTISREVNIIKTNPPSRRNFD